MRGDVVLEFLNDDIKRRHHLDGEKEQPWAGSIVENHDDMFGTPLSAGDCFGTNAESDNQ